LVVERVTALGFLVADLPHAEPVAAVRNVPRWRSVQTAASTA
jgi:hypothetical protein